MNKNVIYLLLSFLLCATTAVGQYRKYQVGIMLSPQVSWIRPVSDQLKGKGLATGFNWGIAGEYNFIKNLSLVSGINVLYNGGKYQYSNTTGTYQRNLSLKSVAIPISFKLRTSPVNNLNYFVQAGLGQTFLVSAKSTDDHNGTSTTDRNAKAIFLRESLIIGGGVEYKPNAGLTLGLGILFDNGLSNVLKGNTMTGSSLKETGYISTAGICIYVLL